MTNLMIVESPAKAKTIQKYMGDQWVVKASYGHIRDLPEKNMGVDLGSFKPDYVVTTKAKKNLSVLKSLAQKADHVYLATDPDREGEAIAWHLQQALYLKNPKRITFNEISSKALQQSLSDIRSIDYDLVQAQEGRRVLDRLVGYTVSPALSNALNQGLSAGRVQSVALRLVVERELEIRNFKPMPYVEVNLIFDTNSVKWKAKWIPPEDLMNGQAYWTDREFAEKVASINEVDITNIDQKQRNRRPPAPFITSTLQQAASVVLKISPKKCMDIAQSLFDEGWISYHRTDNPNLSDASAQEVMDWLRSNGYAEHVSETINTWKAKAGAQQGHEAIRVKDIQQMPDIVKSRMSDEQFKLYSLIWTRTVACQMKSATYNVTVIKLNSSEHINDRVMEFKAKGEVLVYPGWLKLLSDDQSEEKQNDEDNQALPLLNEGQHLVTLDGEVLDKKTKPSPRYTEASLVKKLEEEGIGRPATFASIMNNIIQVRGYVEIQKRKLFATDLGITVCQLLVGKFQFMELDYTRQLEDQLDHIAQGQAQYQHVVSQAYAMLKQEMMGLDQVKIDNADSEKYSCPECEKALRLIRKGKKSFWGCTGYPECGYTVADAGGQPQAKSDKPALVVSNDHPCACGKGHLVQRNGKNGVFWGCTSYPSCRNTLPDDNGKPANRPASSENVDHGKCPDCGSGKLVERTVKSGKNQGKPFIGCSGYPACNHFEWGNAS